MITLVKLATLAIFEGMEKAKMWPEKKPDQAIERNRESSVFNDLCSMKKEVEQKEQQQSTTFPNKVTITFVCLMDHTFCDYIRVSYLCHASSIIHRSKNAPARFNLGLIVLWTYTLFVAGKTKGRQPVNRAWKPISEDTLPDLKLLATNNKGLLNYIAKNTGWSPTISSAADLADNILQMDLFKSPYPSWMTKPTLRGYNGATFKKAVQAFGEKHQIRCAEYGPCRDIMGGVWLKQMLDSISTAIKGESPSVIGYASAKYTPDLANISNKDGWVPFKKFESLVLQKEPDPRVANQFYEWKKCIEKNISQYENDAKQLWGNFWKGVQLCEKLPFMADLKIKNFNNGDETKRHIPPLKREPSVIVTLGIGHDTAAEEALLKELPKDSLFYGADPMQEVNEKLYSKFGTFYPFAVGGKSKISKANVLINSSYVDRNVVHIELVYFLTELIGHKVYDDIWIDAEGAEYDMFPYFFRGGQLDQNDITIHSADDEKKEMFRKFILGMLSDNRYAVFRIVQGPATAPSRSIAWSRRVMTSPPGQRSNQSAAAANL
ncbi:hypothetical protein TELCIR_08886 [Teladorsagia circumcincta]|uniref:Methyltransferase FkbM domain-containing protein n=1 Tax=Teladorsagia circumcincta TaxID=45464 RepID=A0A2G9UGH9_TELCI|nr:hypothetical protein TELCIR_08886 [Teladorsagia circumcincta]